LDPISYGKVKKLEAQLADMTSQVDTKASTIYVDNKIGSIGNTKTFKGSITLASLPTTGNINGDYYYVTDKFTNYCWNGTTWVDIGNSFKINDASIVVGYLNDTIKNVLGMKSNKNLFYDMLTGNKTFSIPTTSSFSTITNYGKTGNHISLKSGRYMIAYKISLNADNNASSFGINSVFRKVSDNSNFGTLDVNSAVSHDSIYVNNIYYGYTVTNASNDEDTYIYMYATGLVTGQVLSFTIDKMIVFELFDTNYNYYIDLWAF
jgi:hypothetical protein